MKSREKNFRITAPLLFLMFWGIITGIMNAADAVGDASHVSSGRSALYPALFLTFAYAILYYLLSFLIEQVKKSTRR